MGYRLLAVLLLAIALIGGGYRWGKHATDNFYQAKEAKRLQDEKSARDAEARRAEKASGELQAQLLQLAIDNDQLQGAFNAYKRKHPILAAVTVRTLPSSGPTEVTQPGAGADPALSFGAVWMWNSSLLGRDAPAGSCGLADTSEGACAADAGIGLQDAWDNQALNARICADDRVRHQRLIDFIKGANKK